MGVCGGVVGEICGDFCRGHGLETLGADKGRGEAADGEAAGPGHGDTGAGAPAATAILVEFGFTAGELEGAAGEAGGAVLAMLAARWAFQGKLGIGLGVLELYCFDVVVAVLCRKCRAVAACYQAVTENQLTTELMVFMTVLVHENYAFTHF